MVGPTPAAQMTKSGRRTCVGGAAAWCSAPEKERPWRISLRPWSSTGTRPSTVWRLVWGGCVWLSASCGGRCSNMASSNSAKPGHWLNVASLWTVRTQSSADWGQRSNGKRPAPATSTSVDSQRIRQDTAAPAEFIKWSHVSAWTRCHVVEKPSNWWEILCVIGHLLVL